MERAEFMKFMDMLLKAKIAATIIRVMDDTTDSGKKRLEDNFNRDPVGVKKVVTDFLEESNEILRCPTCEGKSKCVLFQIANDKFMTRERIEMN